MYIHRAGLRITWDDRKRTTNLRKHGIDLADAADMFAGPLLAVPDVRHEYGESRWIAVGTVRSRVLVVAFAESDDGRTIRLISARKALTHERETYEKAIQDELESRRPHARR